MGIESKLFIVVGCALLAAAGALAAFGFHGPADILTPDRRAAWGWAVDMQYYHASGLILVGLLSHVLGKSWFIRAAGWLMIGGMLVFSGLIYAETLGVAEQLSQVVPTGGGMLMASWLALAIGVIRAK